MILYVKAGCPWCLMAEEWLRRHGHSYTTVDVLFSPADFTRMRQVSGQAKAPVLVTHSGRVLADFAPEELPDFLDESA